MASNGYVRSTENQAARKPWQVNLPAYFKTNHGLALIYFLAITLAEVITNLMEPRIGLVLHGLVLLSLLLHSSLSTRGSQQGFLLALALAPLVRLLSLSLPLVKFPYVYWYALVGAPLFLAAYLTARVTGLNNAQTGLNLNKILIQILVGLTGIGLGYAEYLILRPNPLSEGPNLAQIWLPALILLVFTGLLEEIIFRGIMQYTSLRSLGRTGVWYVAAVFAVLHLGYKSVLDVVFVFAVAMFFSLVTAKTGSIFGVTISHGLTNIGLFLVFPFIFGSGGGSSMIPSIQVEISATRTPSVLISDTPQPTTTKTLRPSSTPTKTSTPTITASPSATVTPTDTPETTNTPSAPLTTPQTETSTAPAPTGTAAVLESTPAETDATQAAPEITGTPISLNQLVIDDGDLSFLRSGGAQYSSSIAFGGDFVWANTTQGPETMQVEWQPALTACGLYELEVYIPSGVRLTHAALYQIGHRKGTATFLLDQSAHLGSWVSLGKYEFQPTSGTFLRLNNNTGEKPSPDLAIAFDASRWTYLETCK